MVPPLLKNATLKVILPAALIIAALLRPSLISAVYVLFGLAFPLLPSVKATQARVPGSVRLALIFLLVFCSAAVLAQIVYQSIEWPKSDAEYVKSCTDDLPSKILRLIGLEKLRRSEGAEQLEALHVVAPEIIAFLFTLLSAFFVFTFNHFDVRGEESVQIVRKRSRREGGGGAARSEQRTSCLSSAFGDTMRRVSNMFILVLLGIVSSLRPSILSGVYFIVFLILLTRYALHRAIPHEPLNKLKASLILYSGLHFTLIFLYQIPFVHDIPPLSSHALWPRLLGLTDFVEVSCNSWWKLQFASRSANLYVNPFAVLLLYQLLIWQLAFTKDGTHRFTRLDAGDGGSSVHEELLNEEDEEGGVRPSIPLKKITSTVMDRQRISQIIRGPSVKKKPSKISAALIAVATFFFSQAYILGLIAMMTWALMFHSIFGLILLLTACVIWIFPNSRSAAFKCAPLIVFYVEVLLCIQYVVCLDYDGIKSYLELIKLDELGVVHPTDAMQQFTSVLSRILLALPIFLILRLAKREKSFEDMNEAEKARRLNNYGTFGSISHARSTSTGSTEALPQSSTDDDNPLEFISELLVSLWLPIVFIFLLAIIAYSNATLFTVGFLIFAASFVLLLKTNFVLFRALIFALLTALIVYCSVVILSVYSYQFDGVNSIVDKLFNGTEILEAIGLHKFRDDESGVFVTLLPSVLLYVVTMLQLKMFHNKWREITDPNAPLENEGVSVWNTGEAAVQGPSTQGNQRHGKGRISERIGDVLTVFMDVLWRILEVHISKLIFFVILCILLLENNPPPHSSAMFYPTGGTRTPEALYVPLLLLITLAVCLPQRTQNFFSLLTCGYVCAVTILKLVWQFKANPIIAWSPFNNTCREIVTFMPWLGLKSEINVGSAIIELLIVMLLLAIQSAVIYKGAFVRRGQAVSVRGLVFPDFNPRHFDKDVASFCKWFIDYIAYKFGVEIAIMFLSIDIWVRMDGIAVITALFLILISTMPRPLVRAVWPFLLIYLAIAFPLQYASHVGLPPDACLDYPWSEWKSPSLNTTSGYLNQVLPALMSLPMYDFKWTGGYFIIDYCALVAVACQFYSFFKESEDAPAGNNHSIYVGRPYEILPGNPHYDFIAKQRSFVDYAKIAVFQYGHWVTLLMVLVAGLGGTSLFALGYIVLSLTMLWQGNSLYVMKNHKWTLFRWNIIVWYTTIVIALKTALQFAACYAGVPSSVRKLFAATCVCANVRVNELITWSVAEKDQLEAAIGLDTVALVFIVLQLRILNSWYFQHVIVEFRSEIVLANRGAVLTNQLIEKEMKEQEEQQDKKLREIKRRTKFIRERTHRRYEELQKRDRDQADIFEAETYAQAKRAGDYYMFDYDPSKDELVKDKETFVPEVDPGASDYTKLDPAQLAYAAISKDAPLKGTLSRVDEVERAQGEKAAQGTPTDRKRMMIDVVGDKKVREEAAAREGGEEEKDEESEEESTLNTAFRFVAKVLTSVFDHISVFLNKRSREHRYVAYVLSQEKAKLKDLKGELLTDVNRRLTDIHNDTKSERGLILVASESDIEKMEEAAINSWQKRNVFARLINAIGYCIAAHTDIVCYILTVFVQLMGAGLITLPLPFAVFFWGTLSNPRPSKAFWVFMIFYSELVVVVKFVCQFATMSSEYNEYINKNVDDPYAWPVLLGVYEKDYFAAWEVALLMGLFYHRYTLRKLGLWKDANVSETFDGEDSTSSNASRDAAGVENAGMEESSSDEQQHQRAARRSVQQQEGEGEEEEGVVTVSHDAPDEIDEVDGGDEDKKRSGLSRFIYQLFYPKFRYIRDLYPLMFALDCVCFLIITLGYSAFGDGGSGNVIGDIKSNRVPLTFVIMLIILSFMMVIDRALYLRKAVFSKLIYHIIIIVFLHVWIFFILPAVTKIQAKSNSTALILYFVKCIYLLVSAWQIRNGFPQLCVGNLIMHSYSFFNMVLYKIFFFAPFVWELRTAIDWTWTDTSMPLFDYFNMEQFYSTIYQLKCNRAFEEAYPAARGEKKGALVKYFMGIPIIIIIILLIWLPLLLFSLLNKVGVNLPPVHASLTISLEGFPPLYVIEAQGSEIAQFSSQDLDAMTSRYAKYDSAFPGSSYGTMTPSDVKETERAAVNFLNDYKAEDVFRLNFRPESQSPWTASEAAIKALQTKLEDNTTATVQLNVHAEVTRTRLGSDKEPVHHTSDFSANLEHAARLQFLEAIKQGSASNVWVKYLIPQFLRIPNEGQLEATPALLYPAYIGNEPRPLKNQSLLNTGINLRCTNSNNDTLYMWTAQLRPDPATLNISYFAPPVTTLPYTSMYGNVTYVELIVFVDRVFPAYMPSIVSQGIIAMYIAFIYLIGRTIRAVLTNSPLNVMLTEMPNVDHLLKICLDIYLVREAKDFVLEQDLFAKLIFLFRSPATLIKWTRYQQKAKKD